MKIRSLFFLLPCLSVVLALPITSAKIIPIPSQELTLSDSGGTIKTIDHSKLTANPVPPAPKEDPYSAAKDADAMSKELKKHSTPIAWLPVLVFVGIAILLFVGGFWFYEKKNGSK